MEGTTFGPYTVEQLLGRGGMGEVYRAFDTETDREVALKVLPGNLADDAEYTERFRRECRAAARLREPHVVPIHRFGEIDGRLYLDMRLVEGSDLATRLKEHGPLPAASAVAVISQIAGALDAAHAEGMVHRDVKPSNILLAGDSIDPGEVFAYLFDFGIATSSGASDGAARDETLTRTGTVPGSLAYLAPERFHGVPADRRVDVYALACVLHQALSGRQPFSGELPTLMHAHLHLPPPPIGRADLPAELGTALDAVVARGMAKDPDQRFPTAGALAAAARAALGSVPNQPLPPPPSYTRESQFGAGPGNPYPQAAWGSAPHTVISNPSTPAQPAYGPPARNRSSRGAIVAAVIAVVVVLGGLGTAGVLLLRGGGSTPAVTPTATPTPQTVVPTAAPGAGDAALLASLPAGFGSANCNPDHTTAGTIGATAYVVCGTGPADGPDGATFSRYGQQSLLDQGFDGAVSDAKVPQVDNGQHSTCRNGTSIATQYAVNNQVAGRVGCYVEPGGAALLFWTDNKAMSFGYLRRSDGNAAVLYDWWSANDFVS